MGLAFQPRAGQVVICDFRGFELPEMVKVRPVVVIAHNRQTRELVTVVPLSTTEPVPLLSCHHRFEDSPATGRPGPCWAKCDMVATVSLARLDRIMWRDGEGRRHYTVPRLSADDLDAVRRAVVSGLGLNYIQRDPSGDL